METNKLALKLQVNKSANKVLFAEAGKDFVDFLLTILATPVGTVVQLLTAPRMVGSIGNIYGSLERMNDSYLKPSMDKDLLLKPKLAFGAKSGLLQLKAQPDPSPKPTNYYRCAKEETAASHLHSSNYISDVYDCKRRMTRRNKHGSKRGSNCSNYITDVYDTTCRGCNSYSMTLPVVLLPDRATGDQVSSGTTAASGYVQDVVTYMVTDDLSISPMSTISSITLLNVFNIQNGGCLEERTVEVEMEQGLMLLKAALQSKTVLTDVFLKAKAAAL